MNKKLLALITVLSFFFSISKGWASFVALPALIIGAPLLWLTQWYYRKNKGSLNHKFIATLFAVQPYLFLASFFFLVGFDDTDRVLVFGFFRADSNSTLAMLNNTLSYLALAVSFMTQVITIAFIAGKKLKVIKV